MSSLWRQPSKYRMLCWGVRRVLPARSSRLSSAWWQWRGHHARASFTNTCKSFTECRKHVSPEKTENNARWPTKPVTVSTNSNTIIFKHCMCVKMLIEWHSIFTTETCNSPGQANLKADNELLFVGICLMCQVVEFADRSGKILIVRQNPQPTDTAFLQLSVEHYMSILQALRLGGDTQVLGWMECSWRVKLKRNAQLQTYRYCRAVDSGY
jgi:hypothetical protein